MIPLDEKIKQILSEVSEGKTFNFAAIIEREDGAGRWDIIVSSDAIQKWSDEKAFLEKVASRLPSVLSKRELINLGIIDVLKSTSDFMQEFHQRIRPNADDRDYFNLTIAGIPLRHAHVFGSESSFMYA
jgi:hypothetical protein